MPNDKTINVSESYDVLFNSDTRYVILTGGRGSGKSFALSLYLCELMLKEYGRTILFTRYTMASAGASIIAEFKEKIGLLNVDKHFDVQRDNITCKSTGSQVIFRGIKTSEGVQTAKLKGLTNMSVFVLDEA